MCSLKSEPRSRSERDRASSHQPSFTLGPTMEPRCIALALVLLCAFIFTGSEGGIPTCCLRVLEKVNPRKLKGVTSYVFQSNGGSCDIDALIVTVKKNRFCIHPKFEKSLQQIIKKNLRKRKQQNSKPKKTG